VSEYNKNKTQKSEYYTGNCGTQVRTRSQSLLITVKIVCENNVSYENYIRIERGMPLRRDGINSTSSVTINPSFVKASEAESSAYKDYLFSGKDGLYKNVHESMKKRGVL
jgi:hypothetical protein